MTADTAICAMLAVCAMLGLALAVVRVRGGR